MTTKGAFLTHLKRAWIKSECPVIVNKMMNNLKIVDLIDVLRSFNVLKFCNFYSGGLVIFSSPA